MSTSLIPDSEDDNATTFEQTKMAVIELKQ